MEISNWLAVVLVVLSVVPAVLAVKVALEVLVEMALVQEEPEALEELVMAK